MAQHRPNRKNTRNPPKQTPTNNHLPNRNRPNPAQPHNKPDKTKPKLENILPKPKRNNPRNATATRKNNGGHDNNPAAKDTPDPVHPHNKPNRRHPRTGNPRKQKTTRNSHKQDQKAIETFKSRIRNMRHLHY